MRIRWMRIRWVRIQDCTNMEARVTLSKKVTLNNLQHSKKNIHGQGIAQYYYYLIIIVL